MTLDTSVLLSIYFEENHSSWASARMNEAASDLRMSTVNLSEVLIKVKDKKPQAYETIKAELVSSSIVFVAPNTDQAVIAAEARLKYPLNLGDCFAYALAVTENDTLLTLDQNLKNLDVPVILP